MQNDDRFKCLPGGVNSPVRSYNGLLKYPFVSRKAFGSELMADNGTVYTDFICSYGAHLFGHNPSFITDEVCSQVHSGISFGTTSTAELEFSNMLSELSGFEQVRLMNSGTEATMTATRIARGYTGKKIVVKCIGNYHGHADLFLAQAGSSVAFMGSSSSKGVPSGSICDTICIEYNNPVHIQEVMNSRRCDDIACVIIEPVAGNMGVIKASDCFLKSIDTLRKKTGCLVIFDEVMTGFRVNLPGVYCDSCVKPDMVCFGKVIGAGFPLAAVASHSNIMKTLSPVGDVYQAGTLSGNPLATAVGYALLKQIDKSTYQLLRTKTEALVIPLIDYITEHNIPLTIHYETGMFSLFWIDKMVKNYDDVKRQNMTHFNDYFTFLYENQIMIPPSPFEANFISLAHTKNDIDKFVDVTKAFLSTTSF